MRGVKMTDELSLDVFLGDSAEVASSLAGAGWLADRGQREMEVVEAFISSIRRSYELSRSFRARNERECAKIVKQSLVYSPFVVNEVFASEAERDSKDYRDIMKRSAKSFWNALRQKGVEGTLKVEGSLLTVEVAGRSFVYSAIPAGLGSWCLLLKEDLKRVEE